MLLAAASARAAEFWETKPFTAWSDLELQQVLTNSPWSQAVGVTLPAFIPGTSIDLRLLLSWRSALPMKQAMVRSAIGAAGTVSPTQQEVLGRAEEGYVLTLAGMPAALNEATANIKADTFLVRAGKPDIAVNEVYSAQQPDGTMILVFAFPRTATIALEDGSVDFVTRIGIVELRKSFSLRELVFLGKLEL